MDAAFVTPSPILARSPLLAARTSLSSRAPLSSCVPSRRSVEPLHMTVASPPLPPLRDVPSVAPDEILVRPVDGIDQYLGALAAAQPHQLVVLKVFAPWCRSCRALVPKLNRLARQYRTVVFLEMDYERNKDLCKRLGVTMMPTFLFYYGALGEIDKFSCGPARAHVIQKKVEDVINGQCSLGDPEKKTT